MWNYKFFREFDAHCHIQFPFVTYNKKEIILAYENPGIIHYVMAKPYHKRENNKYYYYELNLLKRLIIIKKFVNLRNICNI